MEISVEATHSIENIRVACQRIRPRVFISCITYNHEAFLRDALNGFVMQKTDFPFVAIVHDDASTDGTPEIIKEYAEKYPDIILPIFEKENQYSKGKGLVSLIMQKAREASCANYVAICEGDDYWTDPLKLQKQVDFLESHPDYSMCFHNAVEHWEDGGKSDHLFAPLEQRDYEYYELGAGWNVPTASAVLRREVFESELYKRAKACKKFIYGDVLLWMSAIEIGKVYCSAEVMSVYRRHAGGITFTQSPQRVRQIIAHSQAIPIVFGKKYKFSAIDTTLNLSLGMCFKGLHDRNYKDIVQYFLISFKYAPIQTIKKIKKILRDKKKR